MCLTQFKWLIIIKNFYTVTRWVYLNSKIYWKSYLLLNTVIFISSLQLNCEYQTLIAKKAGTIRFSLRTIILLHKVINNY